MKQIELYTLLFVDSFVSNLIVSVANEIIFNSMRIFNTYNNYLIIIITASAVLFANISNYIFGRILYNISLLSPDTQRQVTYDTLTSKIVKLLPIFLFISLIPFWSKFVPVIAGFCRFNFLRIVIICTVLKTCYYSYLLFF